MSTPSYPWPPPGRPPQAGGSLRRIIVFLVAALLVGCLGVVGVVAVVIRGVAGDEEGDGRTPDDGPVRVSAVGAAFAVGGFDFDAGWELTEDDKGRTTTELRATNTHAEGSRGAVASLTLRFSRGEEETATMTCEYAERPRSPRRLYPGRSTTLTCSTFGDVDGYDRIEATA